MDEQQNKARIKSPESRKLANLHDPEGDMLAVGPETQRSAGILPNRGTSSSGPPSLPGSSGGTAISANPERSRAPTLVENAIASINWAQAGLQRVTAEQEAILGQAVDPDWVEIKYPDVPYLPGVYYRKVLTDAFGRGGWALLEVAPRTNINDIYYLPCVLIAEGRPIAKAVGECEIKGGNTKLTDGDLMEACRTNAIVRCCKHLGIAQELMWPAWIRKFKREHCIELGKDKWGTIPLARKDDEAGAKLFMARMEDDEIYTSEPSMVAQFEDEARRIKTEDWPTRAPGYRPPPVEEHE